MPRSFSTRWAQNYSADRWCGKEFWVSIWADSKSVLDVFKAKRRKTPGVYTRTLYTFLVYRSGFCFWVPCHCTQFSDEDSFLQNMQMSSVCFGFRATVLSSQINIHFVKTCKCLRSVLGSVPPFSVHIETSSSSKLAKASFLKFFSGFKRFWILLTMPCRIWKTLIAFILLRNLVTNSYFSVSRICPHHTMWRSTWVKCLWIGQPWPWLTARSGTCTGVFHTVFFTTGISSEALLV